MVEKKKLRLRNVGYRASYQMLYFSTICLFEHTKTPDVKKLKQMRRMRWHTERDNVALLAIHLKVGRVVASMPIKDQKTVDTF